METPNYFSRPDFLNNTEESIPNNAFRNPGNLKQTLAAKPHKPGFKSEPSNDVSLDANHAQAARLSGQMMTSYLPAGNSEYATPSYQRPLLRENANMREGTINDGYQGRGQSQQRSTRARTRNTQLKPLAKETIVIDVDADEDDDEVQILNESPIKVPRKSERSQVPSRLAPSIKRPIELKQEETVTETKVRPLLASVKTSPRRPEARRSPNAASEAVNQRRSLDSDTLLGLYSKQRDSEKQEAVAIQEKLKAELLSTQQECGHFQFELDKARREKDEYRNEVNKSSTILSNYRERISQLEKFLKGLASDRDSLRNEGNDIQRLCLEMEGAKEDYAGDLQAIKQSAGLWETFRARGWEIYVRSLTEARCHIDNLQQQINLQQQQLEDSVGRLAEARDQNLDLEKRNKQNMDLYKDLVGMLDMGNINILAKLGEIRQEVQEKGLNDFYGEKLEECFSLLQHLDDTKEESRKAIEQVNASVSCVSGDMKDNFQTLLEHQTDIRQDQQDHASLMKDDIQSLKYQKQTESRLVQETTDLREQKAIIEERLAAKEREVVDLREHLSHAESLFEKRTGRLNHDISVLKSESEEAERIKAELDEARQKHDLLQGEVAKAQEMLEFRIQQEEIKIEEMRSLKRLYQISQDELNEAHLKIDNLERERDGHETKFNGHKKTMEEHARIYKEKLAIEHENKVHGLESARNDLNRRISLLEEEIKKEKSVNQDKSGKVASLEAEMGSKIKEIVQLKQTMNQMQHQLNISSSGQLIQNPAEVEATKKGKSPIPNQNPAMHKTPQREIPYQKLFSDANKKDVPASATEQMEIPSGRKQENLFTAREKSLVESSQDLMPGLLGQIVRNNSPCGSGSKTPRKSAQVHNIRGSPGKFGEANPGNKNAGYDLGYQDRKDDQTPFQGAQVESINKRVSPSCAIDPHIPGLEPGSILRDEPQRYHIRSFEEFRKDTHSTPLTSPPSSDAGNEPSICADTPTPVTRSNRRKDLNIQDLGNDDHTELEENEEAAEDSIASKDLRECYRQRTLSTLSDFKRDNPEAWSSSGKAAKPTTPNPAAVSPISANQRKPMNKSQNGGRKRPAENEPEAISTPKRNRGSPHPRGTPQSTRGKPKDPRAQSQLSHWDSNVVASGVAASNNRRQPNRGRGGKMYGGKRKH